MIAAAFCLLVACAQQALVASPTERSGARPNLVVLVLDDVGIDQVRLYDDRNRYSDPAGYPYASTPSLESFAAAGIRFEEFRAQPRCSPFRATALTGRYPFEHGQGELARFAFRAPDFLELLVPPAPTWPQVAPLPRLLGAAGYSTAAFGKWHLGLDPVEGGTMDVHPTAGLGFDEWRGTPRNLSNDGSVPGGGHYLYWWVEGGVRTTVQGPWVTSYTTDRALDWMASASEPFFAWVAYSAAHVPLDGADWAPASLHGFGSTPSPGPNTQYRAALEALDGEVGRLVQSMPADRRARTLFVVLGDNGTPGYVVQPDATHDVRYPAGHALHRAGDEVLHVDAAPYDAAHMKGTVYDTSSRTPLLVFEDPFAAAASGLVTSPGRSEPGWVDAVDLYATLCELAGLGSTASTAPHASSFAAVLTDPAAGTDRDWSLLQRFRPNGTSVDNREDDRYGFLRTAGGHAWKLVRRGGTNPATEFYDLTVDPLEATDLGASHAEFAASFAALDALVP